MKKILICVLAAGFIIIGTTKIIASISKEDIVTDKEHAKMVFMEKDYVNKPIEYSYDKINKLKDEIPQNTVLDEKKYCPVLIESNNNNSTYFVKFDKTFFGTLEICFPEKLEKSISFDVIIGELNNDNHVWKRGDKVSSGVGKEINYYKVKAMVPAGSTNYIVPVPKRRRPVEEIMPSGYMFGVTPFAYCEINGYNGPKLTNKSFIQRAVLFPFNDELSSFVSDNNILNDVYVMCKDTIKATTYTGLFVDGYRELVPYEADTYINQLGWFSVENNPVIAKNTLDCLLKNHTWPTEWIFQTIFIAHDYYAQTGDREYLKNIYGELQKCLLLNAIGKDGLIDINIIKGKTSISKHQLRDIVDWPPVERDGFETVLACSNTEKREHDKTARRMQTLSRYAQKHSFYFSEWIYGVQANSESEFGRKIKSPNAVVNAFFYQAILYMADIAKILDLKEDEIKYSCIANEFRNKYHSVFINRDTGLVVDVPESFNSSFHSNMFALKFGLVPEKNKRRVINYIKDKGMICSVYAAQYYLEALCENGETKKAIELMSATGERSWYNMKHGIGSNLTTEAWSFKYKNDMDLNHAWGTAPLNIITRYIVGLKPSFHKEGAYELSPDFGSLKECVSMVPTPKGTISLNYFNKKGRNNLELQIPNNLLVRFKTKNKRGLLIDGQTIKEGNNLEYFDIGAGIHTIIYK